MGAQKLFVFDTHFHLVNMGSVNQFLCQKLVLFVGTVWVSVSTYLLPLFGFLSTYLFGLKRNDRSVKNNSNYSLEETNQKDSNHISQEPETEPQNSAQAMEEVPLLLAPSRARLRVPVSMSSCLRSVLPASSKNKDFMKVNSEEEAVHEELPENSTNGACREDEPEKIEAMTLKEDMENWLMQIANYRGIKMFVMKFTFTLTTILSQWIPTQSQ
ncbi:hypothetical protein F0562_005071 [Nyssa sinensis]|uniref:Uncharacterized protein n=1 Tax=Nyssa sinensis TaxID=561372 RepID=A0A5J5AKP5_9ASTE|nr:hypothetical protein F0562_005071 [Nyssa sinensis]